MKYFTTVVFLLAFLIQQLQPALGQYSSTPCSPACPCGYQCISGECRCLSVDCGSCGGSGSGGGGGGGGGLKKPGGGRIKGCFPGDAQVLMADGTFKDMDQIQVGDKVISIDQTMDQSKVVDVVYLPHLTNELKTDFLQIKCDTEGSDEEKTIQLTPTHFIYTKKQHDDKLLVPVQAKDVEIGSQLASWNMEGNFVDPCWIRDIEIVTLRGAYTAFTESGVLVVNDLMVSSYTSLRNYGADVAHTVASFHRMLYEVGQSDSEWFRFINDKVEPFM